MEYNLYRYLDTNGDGSGTKNANGDYSSTAQDFCIKPPPGKIYVIHRVIVSVEDSTAMQAQEWANFGAALTNGIEIKVKTASEVLVDITDGVPITTNGNLSRVCYDVDIKTWGAGNELLVARFTFAKSGKPLSLNGSKGEMLAFELSDDFEDALSQYFQVQGYEDILPA